MKLFFSGTLKSWLRLPRTKNDVFFNRDFIYILYMYVPVNRPLCMTGKKKIIELKFLLLFSCCPQLSANKIDLFINRNFRDTMCTNYPLIFCRIRTVISSFFSSSFSCRYDHHFQKHRHCYYSFYWMIYFQRNFHF